MLAEPQHHCSRLDKVGDILNRLRKSGLGLQIGQQDASALRTQPAHRARTATEAAETHDGDAFAGEAILGEVHWTIWYFVLQTRLGVEGQPAC